MEKFVIYYRHPNGYTETFRVTEKDTYSAINRFHKVIGYYPIINTKTENSVVNIQRVT
jgi:hypothetical protein